MLLKGEVNNVTLQNSQTSKSSDYSNKSVNIINLINKLKFHETKQKRQTLQDFQLYTRCQFQLFQKENIMIHLSLHHQYLYTLKVILLSLQQLFQLIHY